MYTAYFGLKEKPFSIAPDPQYLFMSDRHREALAHLTYGLGDAGGFVLLTGEVGTGKTTVSRCLMERLPENTQAAFILNPTLSSQELLATICDELKIRYRKTGATLKTLTDKIQDKLLKNHKEGINTLLIIDEAQHLQPEVLEQLRLLTNLETNTKKLLQVILIGQPELQTLLKRRDLRQLAQRITARYHLLPLNKQEVVQYIKHRLSIAECIRAVFSPSAMSTLHDICDGIPRLINLVCERSLLNAYSSNVAIVDKKMVLLSAQEALGDEYQVIHWWQRSATKWAAAIALLSVVAVSAFMIGTNNNNLLLKLPNTKAENNLTQKTTSVGNRESITTGDNADLQAGKQALDNKVEELILPDNTNKLEVAKNTATNNKLITKQGALTKKEPLQVNVKQPTKPEVITPKIIKPVAVKPFKVKAVDGVSNELLNRFKEAVDNSASNDFDENSLKNDESIQPLEKMPTWVQNGVPPLQFDQHIYASDGKGWVKVNDRDRYEGDNIARELVVVRILPQKVILSFRGEKFTMPALSTW